MGSVRSKYKRKTDMGAGHDHNHSFEGLDPIYQRRLKIVIAINALGFAVEMVAGQLGGSQALKADSLDFLADALTYALSFAVIGMSLKIRARAALVKGVSLVLIGLWVAGSTVYRVFYLNQPSAETMGLIGALAFAANLATVLLLIRYKDGDANVRSVWLCSRNDAIGNVIVVIAGLGVWGTGTPWPDLIVAAIMAGLFLWSSVQILTQAREELKEAKQGGHDHDHHDHAHGHDHAH
jgi:cation diffusion facilitator family transporter